MPFDQQDCRQTISNWIDEFNNYINNPFDHQNDGKNLFLVDSFWRDALGPVSYTHLTLPTIA